MALLPNGRRQARRQARRLASLGAATAALGACTQMGTVGLVGASTDDQGGSETDTETGSDGSHSVLPPREDLPRLDVAGPACTAPVFEPCDGEPSPTLGQILGMGCPGDPFVDVKLTGDPAALLVHQGTLGDGTYPPQHGSQFLILSTGDASEVPLDPSELDSCAINPLMCPTTEFWTSDLPELPPPLTVTPVSDTQTCAENPDLVGTGDCSNTLASQWSASGCALPSGDGDGDGDGNLLYPCDLYDYAELRFTLDVPTATTALAFDFAFLTVEYPEWTDLGFNDMFIAWVESEAWTGNISFDRFGNPISVNASFLDYKSSPELENFALEGHGGTQWLSSTTEVREGETVELIFAIFDMGDHALDSVVLLDNLHWTCDEGGPRTVPVP